MEHMRSVLGFHEDHLGVKLKKWNFSPRGRGTRTRMKQGEEGPEIPDEVLAKTAAASESADGKQKDTGGKEDSDENGWGHAMLPRDVYNIHMSNREEKKSMWSGMMSNA
jgi:hypothetical protein